VSGDASTLPARPEFDRLVSELRALARDQHIAKSRAAGAAVMRRAEALFKARKLPADEFVRLASLQLRLDAELPLPEGRRP